MSTSIIDGTVDQADLKRAKGGIAVFRTIRFQLDDGTTRTVTKYVVPQDIADKMIPGTRGRFYLFSAFDIKGIHGFRGADGVAIFKYPGSNNARLFILTAIISLAWIVLRATTQGDVPLLGVALLILGVVGYIFMSKGGREAKQQFEADDGPAALAPQHA